MLTGPELEVTYCADKQRQACAVPAVLEDTEDISDQIHSLYHFDGNTNQDFTWHAVLCSDYGILVVCPILESVCTKSYTVVP